MSRLIPFEEAVQRLRAGGVVAFPTETVYGLGAAVGCVEAVARVFAAKDRPRFDPLIVHVASTAELAGLTTAGPEVWGALAERFWPGPLTLVLPKRDTVPDLVTSGLPTVAVRCPAHDLARALIQAAGTPLAAPSANRFGRLSPTTADAVLEQLGDGIDGVLDGGPCRVGVESTILDLTGSMPAILRQGGLAQEELEAVLGPVAVVPRAGLPQAPGMLLRHYAPCTPVHWRDHPAALSPRAGLLQFKGQAEQGPFAAVEVLSPIGDLEEAAARLFAALRKLDALGLDEIRAEKLPEEGLGRAINDRLTKAVATFLP